jgi:MFS family permease
VFTSALSSLIIPKFERSKLILWTSVIPLIGHSIIYSDFDCDLNGETSFGKFILILGFIFFGMGIGSYYSVSFSAVGLSIPQPIRGMGYACMGFFQTIALTLIPIASGYIVESEEKVTNRSLGYKESSLLFIILCLSGVVVSFLIYRLADEHSFIYNDEDELEGDEECEKFTVEGVAEIKI